MRGRSVGRWANTMRFFKGPTVLIIDELGYLPMPAEDANALFQVISQRYLHGSSSSPPTEASPTGATSSTTPPSPPPSSTDSSTAASPSPSTATATASEPTKPAPRPSPKEPATSLHTPTGVGKFDEQPWGDSASGGTASFKQRRRRRRTRHGDWPEPTPGLMQAPEQTLLPFRDGCSQGTCWLISLSEIDGSGIRASNSARV